MTAVAGTDVSRARATGSGPVAAGATAASGGSDAEAAEAADRGSLTVADRVVERVAGYAVSQVEAAMAAPRRVLGVSVGDSRPHSAARVDASVYGDVATVAATIAVAWPAAVRSVGADVRRRVREDVLAMTGVRVEQVDLEIASMAVPERAERRVR